MNTPMRVLLEIAVQRPEDARLAFETGADRIELCQALEVGGLTPSIGTIELAVEIAPPRGVAVLVRPRGGGFVYDDAEVEWIARDIAGAVEAGVGSLVVGALTPEGAVDRRALQRWREAAGDTPLVFHRAIDAAPDPQACLDALIEEGVHRVLTSGGAARSVDGLTALAEFVRRAAGAIEIMAGGGVRVEDIPALIAAGVHAVHLSARGVALAAGPSGPGGGVDTWQATSGETVAAAAAALRTS